MLKVNRHDTIMRLLSENGSLLVSDACEILGCSDQTIRRDFQELEEQGRLKRIHGGAFIPTAEDRGVPVDLRAKLIVREKLQMAQVTASAYIKNNDVIMLDSSTTCNTLARHLMDSQIHVNIITNSIATVSAFSSGSPSAHLICTGGRYKERLGAFIGTDAVESISAHVADKAFISCNAISMEHGMLDNYESQMDVRRAMLAHAREKYLLVDHTKFDDQANFIIGDFSSINGIITDQEPDEVWLGFFREHGINVIW